MTNKIKQKTLNKVAKNLLSLNAVEHKRPKEPTKSDVNKKFVMRIARNGKVKMNEIKE